VVDSRAPTCLKSSRTSPPPTATAAITTRTAPTFHRVCRCPERVPPNATDAEKAAQRASMCANPTVLTNFRNAQWNPDGSFPVITFCDCNNCQGDYNGDRDMPTEVLLAVDYNRNNRRDYGEPIIWTPQEPFP
jgi:hypothetical protein